MGVLDGKVALITGGGKGVGLGIAKAMSKEGADIFICGRHGKPLAAVTEELRANGVRAEYLVGNVSEADDCTTIVDTCVERLGGVDILVNNANDAMPIPLLDVSDDDFTRFFQTGPLAVLRLMKACHPLMVARGGGSVINLVTSAAVRWDMATFGPYAAVKEATRSLTRAAGCEWGKDNIRVNAIAPHAMTPSLQWWTEAYPDEADAFVKSIPLGRIGDAEADIGRIAVFLSSQDAGYLSGVTIPADGGHSRWG